MLQFRSTDGEQILVKVAISSVSIEGARKNLAAELPGWDFDKVRADAKAAWNKELSKIEVSGGTDDQMTTFYTALYHTMIHPSIFNDVDGSYRGHDGKIHNINGRGARRLQKPARSKRRKLTSATRSGRSRGREPALRNGGRSARPSNTPSSPSGTHSAPRIRFTRSSSRSGRPILSTHSSASTSRAGACRFGSCGATRPTR